MSRLPSCQSIITFLLVHYLLSFHTVIHLIQITLLFKYVMQDSTIIALTAVLVTMGTYVLIRLFPQLTHFMDIKPDDNEQRYQT